MRGLTNDYPTWGETVAALNKNPRPARAHRAYARMEALGRPVGTHYWEQSIWWYEYIDRTDGVWVVTPKGEEWDRWYAEKHPAEFAT